MNTLVRSLTFAMLIGMPVGLSAQTGQGDPPFGSRSAESLVLQQDGLSRSIKVFRDGKRVEEIPYTLAKTGMDPMLIVLQETLQKYFDEGWRIDTSMDVPGGQVLILSRKTNR